MHREVTIGHVATYIADRQLHKSARTVALCLPLLLADTAMAQSDEEWEGLTLPVITITAGNDSNNASEGACATLTHQDIQHLTATTVGELLEALPNIDVRSRGVNDMQGDITLRGGTFDQVVVLLNGINIADPQTGHHNLDLPIDLSMVERIELLSASALVRYGVSSFCGGINIVTGQHRRNRLGGSLSGGSYGTADFVVGADRMAGPWQLAASAAYHRSDGYRPNTDYRNGNAFVQAQRKDSNGAWQMQIGGQFKDFGSQSFYSFKYPDQYEATRTLIAAIQRRQRIGAWQGDMAAYGRIHKDRFELFRHGLSTPPAWYSGHNYHLSSVAGLRARVSNQWALGLTTFGLEYRCEDIISNVLGDSLERRIPVAFESGDHFYTLGKTRHRGNAFATHTATVDQWQLTAAFLLHDNSMSRAGYGYALSAQWEATDRTTLAASVGRSDRQPTFTDLYYHSATQIANPHLLTEVSHLAEFSARYAWHGWTASANLYLRHGSNIIDWIRQPDESVWHSMNHSRIDAIGGDARIGYRNDGWVRNIEIAYAYCDLRQHADEYISQYALDYLQHSLTGHVSISPCRGWLLKVSADYHHRIGAYTHLDGTKHTYGNILLIDAAVEYNIRHLTLFVEARNLLNTTYYDYGGIPLPGANCRAGLRYNM